MRFRLRKPGINQAKTMNNEKHFFLTLRNKTGINKDFKSFWDQKYVPRKKASRKKSLLEKSPRETSLVPRKNPPIGKLPPEKCHQEICSLGKLPPGKKARSKS